MSGPVRRAKLPAPTTAADRDRARLAVASAARDATDAAHLLAVLGLDGPDLADHLTRRHAAATTNGDTR